MRLTIRPRWAIIPITATTAAAITATTITPLSTTIASVVARSAIIPITPHFFNFVFRRREAGKILFLTFNRLIRHNAIQLNRRCLFFHFRFRLIIAALFAQYRAALIQQEVMRDQRLIGTNHHLHAIIRFNRIQILAFAVEHKHRHFR